MGKVITDLGKGPITNEQRIKQLEILVLQHHQTIGKILVSLNTVIDTLEKVRPMFDDIVEKVEELTGVPVKRGK